MLDKTIKLLRIEMRLTQEKMAHLIGVPKTTYQSWEMGKNLPNFENLNKLIIIARANGMEEKINNAYTHDKTKRGD